VGRAQPFDPAGLDDHRPRKRRLRERDERPYCPCDRASSSVMSGWFLSDGFLAFITEARLGKRRQPFR
jgi:hypothetical protein